MICLLNIFKKFSFFWVLFYFRSICNRYQLSFVRVVARNLFSFAQFYFVNFFLPKTPYLKIYYSNSSLFVYVYS